MKTVELSIEGMKCMGCVTRIKNVLDNLKGIHSYDLTLEEKKLILNFKKEKALLNAIEAIENLGFKIIK